MLNNTPNIIGNDTIGLMPAVAGDDWQTTVPTDIVYMQTFVNQMPQFFPERESTEYKTLDKTQAKTLLGARGSISDPLLAYYTAELLAAHAKMVELQNTEIGCFEIVWYIAAEDRSVRCKFTVDEEIPTPDGEAGDLSTKEIRLANASSAMSHTGNWFTDPTFGASSISSKATRSY